MSEERVSSQDRADLEMTGGAPGITRSDFLKRGVAAGAALGASGLIGQTVADAMAARPKPKVGGTLRVGLLGGSASDSVDPIKHLTSLDFARATNLYDPLTDFTPQATITNVLAEELIPNAKANIWTIRLKKGIEFHNGKSLTADDVVYSLRRYTSPILSGHDIDWMGPQNIHKVDRYTVRLTLPRPYSVVPEALAGFDFGIVPVGFNPKKPVGTGPFTFQSFTPGQQSVFLRNKNYWREVYPDQLIIHDFSDPTAEQNALIAGQLDAIDAVPASSIPIINGNKNLRLLNSPSGAWRPFCMRVDVPPFNDPRVRQAMRLVVDRPQMVSNAYAGQGAVGNDIYARFDPAYNHSLPQREQDISQAKALFKAAGVSQVTLTTTNSVAGLLESSQVLAQQAQAAGVTVTVQQVSPATFYGPSYLSYPFCTDYWGGLPFFIQVSLILRTNETHWGQLRQGLTPQEKQWLSLLRQAKAAVKPALRAELVHEMQKLEYNSGGYIIPTFVNTVNAYSSKVLGFVPNKTGYDLNAWNFRLCHFA